jgi:hypothetical protein
MTNTFGPTIAVHPPVRFRRAEAFCGGDRLGASDMLADSTFDSCHRNSDDVFPAAPFDDDTDVGLSDTEPLGHPSLISALLAVGANESNVVVGESGVVVPCPEHSPVSCVAPALPVHVGLIVRVGSEEEMIGVNAVGYVADVADLHSIGNRTVRKFVRETVDVHLSTIDSEFSVSSPRPTSIPQETTRIRFRGTSLKQSLCDAPVIRPVVHTPHSTTTGSVC